MAGTRRSARVAGNKSSSPPPEKTATKAGTKRKSDASAKDTGSKKAQKTLEETLPTVEDASKDVEMKDEPPSADDAPAAETDGEVKPDQPKEDDKPSHSEPVDPVAQEESAGDVKHGEKDADKDDAKPTEPSAADETDGTPVNGATNGATNGELKTEEADQPAVDAKPDVQGDDGDLVKDESARDSKVPSTIIEKGIIYFFTRGRVGVDQPEGPEDLQRTYFVMRPIPTGAKLGDGAIDDSKSNRLIALPKKVFPKTGKDRFMAFIEKGKASMSELREEFFKSSEYETATMGTRETPSVMPIGEGVYAITETGRTAHLVYMLTIPRSPGPMQDEMGLSEKGSFVLSLKNPTKKGPSNAQLPESPDFPQEILDDFRGLAWLPVKKSDYLDYPNAQLLLIGEGFDGAVEPAKKDENEGKENPEEELEKLEDEDEVRVEALDGEDAVYADLHISKKEYPEVKTTW